MYKSLIRKFRRDEDGSATVETVLWLPFYFFFFLLILDAAMIFANHARIVRIVQDANRFYAVGGFVQCTDAEDWVRVRVDDLAPSVVVTCDRNAGVATMVASMDSGELDLTGSTGVFGNFFGGFTINATSQYVIELGA